MNFNPADKLMIDSINEMSAKDMSVFISEMNNYINLVERQIESGGDIEIQSARKFELAGSRSVLKIASELLITKSKAEQSMISQ